jgi:pyruvate-formate lyase-activating enzyme
MRDYYCSQKFDWLEIRLSDGFVASCCKATPDRVTSTLLKSDPQGYFNWPRIIEEREMMLKNQRVPGCEACWTQEDQGLASRRTTILDVASTNPNTYGWSNTDNALDTTYHDVRQTPKFLNIITSNTCNLTCSYCCKTFSSTWLKNIIDHGDYNIPGYVDRYNANNLDRVIHRSSQKIMGETELSDLIAKQIQDGADTVEQVVITGGEPLLYSKIKELLEIFGGKNISLFTGLGLPAQRLRAMIPLLKKYQVKICVSAENTNAHHEFNRYGYSYQQFEENLQLLEADCEVMFTSTISNLTLFDFPAFVVKHGRSRVRPNIVSSPEFFLPSVLDADSKARIAQALHNVIPDQADMMIDSMNAVIPTTAPAQLTAFLSRFSQTRGLDLNIFPQSFLDWLQSSNKPSIIPIVKV